MGHRVHSQTRHQGTVSGPAMPQLPSLLIDVLHCPIGLHVQTQVQEEYQDGYSKALNQIQGASGHGSRSDCMGCTHKTALLWVLNTDLGSYTLDPTSGAMAKAET